MTRVREMLVVLRRDDSVVWRCDDVTVACQHSRREGPRTRVVRECDGVLLQVTAGGPLRRGVRREFRGAVGSRQARRQGRATSLLPPTAPLLGAGNEDAAGNDEARR